MTKDIFDLIDLLGSRCIEIAIRAIVVMFVAAVVAKRTTVFFPISYVESLAWAAGYGLVRGLIHKDETT